MAGTQAALHSLTAGATISGSAAADVPLILVVEPQAPAWAQHIVHFLQTGELPEEQEEVERVARQSSMYQLSTSHCTEEGSTA